MTSGQAKGVEALPMTDYVVVPAYPTKSVIGTLTPTRAPGTYATPRRASRRRARRSIRP